MNPNYKIVKSGLSIAQHGTSAGEEERQVIMPQLTTSEVLNCMVIGNTPIPCVKPNISSRNEIEDIERLISNSKKSGLGCCDITTIALTYMTVIGCCYACKNTILINSNEYGFIIDSGKVLFLKPGWHYIGYPFMTGLVRHDISSDYMRVNNVMIIRIRQDEIGIGLDNTNMEILLPGTHVRTNAAYIFRKRCRLNDDVNEGPLKVLTVRTGNSQHLL